MHFKNERTDNLLLILQAFSSFSALCDAAAEVSTSNNTDFNSNTNKSSDVTSTTPHGSCSGPVSESKKNDRPFDATSDVGQMRRRDSGGKPRKTTSFTKKRQAVLPPKKRPFTPTTSIPTALPDDDTSNNHHYLEVPTLHHPKSNMAKENMYPSTQTVTWGNLYMEPRSSMYPYVPLSRSNLMR